MIDDLDLESFEPVARIIVIGVGGAGSNAVNRMISDQITNVEFYVANTDKQALASSKAPGKNKIILGQSITNGLGAGGEPQVGRDAAESSEKEIREIIHGANMVFIAAGMGGGTGTGAAPVIGKIAKEEGALTVAIVTRPFTFEGDRKISYSVEGLNELKANVDSLIVVSNDQLLINYGKASLNDAFSEADIVLSRSVKVVIDLIMSYGIMNLDFADVKNTLKDSGLAIIGYGEGRGERKAEEAAQNALRNEIAEQGIKGARKAICRFITGINVSLYECHEALNYIKQEAGGNLDLKMGLTISPDVEPDEIILSIIASKFENEANFEVPKKPAPGDFDLFNMSRKQVVPQTQQEAPAQQQTNSGFDISTDDSIIPDFLKDL